MKFKSFLAASIIAVSSVGAFAQSFVDGVADFNAKLYGNNTSFTSTFNFDNLAAGTYDVLGDISSSGLVFTTITLDGHVWTPVLAAGKYRFGEISYTGNTPMHLLVSGTKLASAKATFTGSVSVTAVPEPETFAMLLAGLGLMGTIARRRNKVAAAA